MESLNNQIADVNQKLADLTAKQSEAGKAIAEANALGGKIGDETIARAIIVLAHALNFDVVAEGVEEEAQYKLLAAMGCDLIQGFLIGRPAALGEIARQLDGGGSGDREHAVEGDLG